MDNNFLLITQVTFLILLIGVIAKSWQSHFREIIMILIRHKIKMSSSRSAIKIIGVEK